MRLAFEAREIADLQARRQHLACGLARLIGTTALTLLTDEEFAPGGWGRIVAAAGHGNVGPIIEAHAQHENEFNPALRRMVALVHAAELGHLHVQPRVELVADRLWQRSDYFNQYFAPARFDDCIYAARRTGAESVDGGVLVRARGERRFGDEERGLVEMFFESFAALWHPPAPQRWIQQLPPRLRRVLDLLLDGLSEKEVADRAELSRASTHQYVVELYRRAGVSSRGQLMVKALRSPPTL
jgi:DNA-binding CsgD family transcriptional regulator